MTIAIQNDTLIATILQPTEALALSLALLFNRYGWDTERIRRVGREFTVVMTKGLLDENAR